MNLKKIAGAVVILSSGSMFVIPSAYAVFGMGDSAVYIGASAGQAKYKDTPGVLSNRDDKDTGYKVFAGTQINPIFGVEATYFDLGKYSGNSSAFNGVTISSDECIRTGHGMGASSHFNGTDRYDLCFWY